MVTLFNRYILLAVLTLNSIAAAASPTATIDRSVIAEEDTLTLTLRVNSRSVSAPPDLSPLQKDFEIVSNSQSSQHIIRNDRSESFTEWTISLFPKRKGELTIPAISIAGEKTPPLSVRVIPGVPTSPDILAPVFLETEVDSQSVYVQQQLIFTVRIFQSIQLDSMNISEPEFDQALVEKLSQNSFQRRLQNTPYRVHELKYAIFPQQSGELTIPELVFTARETTARRSVFDLRGQGRPIRKLSKQHNITVRNIPAGFSGDQWLPASNLTLTESWSSDPTTIKVGDSITRTITLRAEGLVASQLPEITLAETDGAKFYPDQGTSETTASEQGASALRVDSTAIIPTRAGTLRLPAIRLQWWDTNSDQLREAVIAEQTLSVAAAVGDLGQAVVTEAAAAPPVIADTGKGAAQIWPWLTGLFALLWLVTLYFFWQLKRNNQQSTSEHAMPQRPSEARAFKKLAAACSNNNPAEARTAVIGWAQCHWPESRIASLQDLNSQLDNDSPLGDALSELDSLLYGEQQGDWKGEQLLARITALRSSKAKPQQNKQPLQSLYPT